MTTVSDYYQLEVENKHLKELLENTINQIQMNHKSFDILKETYLNEKCGYCNEKMIVIGSRHVHACKHDLINVDKDKIMDENKQLKEGMNNNAEIAGVLTEALHKIQRDYSHLLRQKKDCEDRSYSFEQKLEQIKELHDNVNLLESDSQTIDILNLLQEILNSQEKE